MWGKKDLRSVQGATSVSDLGGGVASGPFAR